MAINWTTLGTYLGRTVKMTVLTGTAVSEQIDLATATVLLVFSRDYAKSEIGKQVLQLVITSCPVAIAVAGTGASAAFDDLLKTAPDSVDSRHIMTAYLDNDSVDDLAESFLFGVIPAEERFDEWNVLAVLIVEDSNSCYQRMVTAMSKWMNEGMQE